MYGVRTERIQYFYVFSCSFYLREIFIFETNIEHEQFIDSTQGEHFFFWYVFIITLA